MAVKHTIRKDGNGNLKNVTLTPLKAIRHYCVECMGFSQKEIEGCFSSNCPLFPYRQGHNISRQGIGQNRTKKG